MKILEKIVEIFSRYELHDLKLPDNHKNIYSFIRDNPDIKKDFISTKTDNYLFDKYDKNIPNGWYGFAIGNPIIPEWIDILEEVLDICIENDPNFEIYQIKIKFGGIRFYCGSTVIEDLMQIEMLIEDKLFDEALIY